MYTKIIFLSFLTFFFTNSSILGQAITSSNDLQHFVSETPISISDFILNIENILADDQKHSINIKEVLKAKSGYTHYKLEQYWDGIRVLGSNYNIHCKLDQVVTANGQLHTIKHIPFSNEFITKQEILRSITGYINASNKNDHFHNTKETIITQSHLQELVIVDLAYPKVSGTFTKAYIVPITLEFPYDELIFVIDAFTGHVIHEQSIICGYGVDGTAVTKYYGEQQIVVDSIGSSEFQLKDSTRNITTYTAKSNGNAPYFNDTKHWDLTSEDKDEVALDAHYCTSKFYDMMLDLFQYQGIDGNGGALDPVVHANSGRAYLNAFWNGSNAYFGNGDCHHDPLTTLAVVGHEFTHGVTDYTSDLIYAEESGAINESLSDIFGKALEYYYDNENFSWEMDPVFAKTVHSSSFRDMANPNAYDDPSFYKGEFWSESGAVHTNSGVFNYWFYLLVDGAKGINEKGYAYEVAAMPIEEILQVVFFCQRYYLTPSSNYPELYLHTIDAAKELYGDQSPLLSSLLEAWNAVGLPHETVDTLYDLIVTTEVQNNVTCYQDYLYSIDIKVTNIGSEVVPAGTEVGVNIISNDGLDTALYMTLSNDLLPEESLDFTYADGIYITDNRIYFYNLKLILEDDNSNNNFAFGYIRNFTRDQPYLDLTDVTARFEECFKDQLTISFSIYNQSCGVIPEGTDFEFEITNGNSIIASETYSISRNINSNAREGFTIVLDNVTAYQDLQIKLISSALDFDKELSKMDVFDQRHVVGAYYNGFDDESFFEDFRVVSNPIIFDYDNNNYLGSFGAVNGLSRVPCPDLIDNIELITFGKTSFEACIDLSQFATPYFDFDLVQFRQADTDYPMLEQNSTIVQIAYEHEGNQFKELISGQTEGLIKGHSYALPANYKGKLRVEMFAHAGALDQVPSIDYDANLIDNVKFRGLTQVVENEYHSKLKVFPNPSNQQITVASSEQITRIEIYNVSGVKIGEYSKPTINVENLTDGLYLLKVHNNNGSIQIGKFMKNL